MIKTFFLLITVSIDGFAAAIALGSAKIKIPVKSAFAISLIGALFLGISVFAGGYVDNFLPPEICEFVSKAMLITLGTVNLLGVFIKKAARKCSDKNPINMFYNGEKADTDNSKDISLKEAIVLSTALSADSIVTGISFGIGEVSAILLTILSLIFGFTAIFFGSYIGKKIISTTNIDFSFLCGILLISIAFIK